eukprot:2100476-Pleurochrysis_carterae.AAC.1
MRLRDCSTTLPRATYETRSGRNRPRRICTSASYSPIARRQPIAALTLLQRPPPSCVCSAPFCAASDDGTLTTRLLAERGKARGGQRCNELGQTDIGYGGRRKEIRVLTQAWYNACQRASECEWGSEIVLDIFVWHRPSAHSRVIGLE